MKKIIVSLLVFWAGVAQAEDPISLVPLDQAAIDVANLMIQPGVRICLDNIAAKKRGTVKVASIQKADFDDLYYYVIKGVILSSNSTDSEPFQVWAGVANMDGDDRIKCFEK